jgi:Protein of unknown function (DUF3551)
MHLPILSLLLIAAALLGEMQVASAQSPTSYPWCAKSFKMESSSGISCYFTSREQCMTTLSGIGGYCFQSPYYHSTLGKTAVQPRSRRLSGR